MKTQLIIHPDELTQSHLQNLRASGADILGIHPTGGLTAEKSLAELVSSLENEKFRVLVDYARDLGFEIEYELHAASYLMPRELFSEHPEYFRMNKNGERTSDFNFCPSCEDAILLYAERAASLVKKLYRSNPRYYLWMDDNKDVFCHCPKCKHLTPSDQQLIVQNRVAKRLREENPHARVAYLAYFECIEPPRTVKPDKGVFLEYAPFEKYTAKGDDAPDLIKKEQEALLPLIEAFGRSDFKILEYWYDNSMLSSWKKPPKRFALNKAELKADLDYYKSLSPDTIASFACFLGEDYTELYGKVDFSDFPLFVNNCLHAK